jgi:two-component system CheB/CheR fusion protein
MFTVEISDTGIGIEPEVMRRLFNAFEQGEQTLSRRFGGLGLGLTISKTLVDLQGGSLAAFSAGKDQGASFSVRLPAMAIAGEPRPAPTAALPKRAFKILLVEDNEDTQRVLARFLKLAGHEVCTASSVHAAMDAATTSTFDLLLCDIGLPDGTGWDLMQSLRARCPIRGVALTGFASSEDAQKSLAAGFAEHLAKPIIPEKLEAAIQRAAS